MENQRARKLRFLLDESSRWESSEIDGQAEIVTKKGKPVLVILPIKQYQEILERLEDAEDVAWLKKARQKKLHYRPLEDALADLAKS